VIAPSYIKDDSGPHSSRWESNYITRSIDAVYAFQVSLVRFAAFENHFCGHEQECARVYRRTFAADDQLKFSEEVSFGGLHGRIVDLRRKDVKITEEGYCQSVGLRVTFTAQSLRLSDSTTSCGVR
jgi:hypothetical protein